MISRIAPPQSKGLALGIYNTTQAFGLAAGGALGGFLAQRLGADAVYAACGLLTLAWLGLGLTMAPLPARVKHPVAQTVAQTN
jgi:predicted MFS family arabinose efflux permease